MSALSPGIKPAVLIGSFPEGCQIAETLQVLLSRYVDVLLWRHESYQVSSTHSAELLTELDRVDFAILVLTPENFEENRGVRAPLSRDNVILELGLFAGRLGFERTYFLIDKSVPVKLPFDLLGFVGTTYSTETSGDLDAVLGPAVSMIRRQVLKLGERSKFAGVSARPKAVSAAG